jgi:hypothetical protein
MVSIFEYVFTAANAWGNRVVVKTNARRTASFLEVNILSDAP